MAKKHFTSTATTCKFEYVRRGANGLELVTRTNGHETVTPVRATGRSENGGKRLVIGYEPVFVNGELRTF